MAANPAADFGVTTGGPAPHSPASDFGVTAAPAASAPAKKGGGGWLHEVAKYTGTDLAINLAKDVGATGAGVLPGLKVAGQAAGADLLSQFTNPLHPKSELLNKVIAPAAKSEKDYYSHDVLHHLYTHPLQPIIDALTVASGGAAVAGRVGKVAAAVAPESKVAKLATLGDRGTITTRSPRNIATGKGPVHTDITSTAPISRAREQGTAALKARRTDLAAKYPKLAPVMARGGELKAYGKQIQTNANQAALGRLAGLPAYQKATKGLSANEWTALHLRAMDIHPDDLATLWKGTTKEAIATDPKIRDLVLNPTPKLLKAEPAARSLSLQGAAVYKTAGKLKDETALARPELTKQQASEVLGRPVKTIHGDPYYFPHTIESHGPVSPLAASGGGKAVPRKLGSMKQNLGVLALSGKLHLRSDVLGPEFLRRVKYVKYDEIHNALVRGAVRVSRQNIEQQYGGKLPKGYEYVREKAATRIPPTIRAEGDQHVPLQKLIPNAEDLHDSQLAKDGFSTTDQARAHSSGGNYYIIPKATVKAATGEFTRSSDFTHNFVKRPLSVWRAAVLGLRVGFLTNNLVGNSLMYAVKTGGQGALRDLFGTIVESHGRETALKVLNSQATPPGLRADLYKEFFPEQVQGTFGRTQSPSTSMAHTAGQKGAETWRTATGAIPKLTSKVAEEYPRRALIRHYIRHSPEFKAVHSALPKQTRTFENAARQVLEGKGGAAYQRYISKRVNQALGDYLNLSPFERNVLRNTLPFYAWYRAISTTSYHLAVDTPLRANILGQIGRIGKEQAENFLGQVPSFLQDSIGLGNGPQGTKRVLSTQSLNPYATLEQLVRGSTTDYSALGFNPFVQGPIQYLQRAKGNVSPAALLASPLAALVQGLPPSRLIAPPGPSKLYPTRKGRLPQILSNLGVPIKEYNPAVAALQAKQGR